MDANEMRWVENMNDELHTCLKYYIRSTSFPQWLFLIQAELGAKAARYVLDRCRNVFASWPCTRRRDEMIRLVLTCFIWKRKLLALVERHLFL
jgi:hypothetical protein